LVGIDEADGLRGMDDVAGWIPMPAPRLTGVDGSRQVPDEKIDDIEYGLIEDGNRVFELS
jgi:hypothetical protein